MLQGAKNSNLTFFAYIIRVLKSTRLHCNEWSLGWKYYLCVTAVHVWSLVVVHCHRYLCGHWWWCTATGICVAIGGGSLPLVFVWPVVVVHCHQYLYGHWWWCTATGICMAIGGDALPRVFVWPLVVVHCHQYLYGHWW
jgi:uncharacterized membrane protein HdeD (DUF308 family)